MSIIDRVVELLKNKGANQADICKFIGIKENVFTTWKTRGTDPPAKCIIQICEYFNVSPYYLLTGEEKNETLSDSEKELITDFRSLNEKGQNYVQSQVSLAKEVYKK